MPHSASVRRLVGEFDSLDYNPLRDARLWLIASLTALLVYGSEISSFTLSIDEELSGFQREGLWAAWLRQGRWGMALLTFVTPPLSATPFLPTLVFCAGLAASAVLLAGQFIASRREAFCFVAMFISCPTWPHIGEFNTFSWGIGIGLCACTLALWFGRSGGTVGAAHAAVLLAFSIAIYQSFILIYVAAVLLHYGLAESRRSQSPRALAGLIGGCVAGIALYYLVLKATSFWFAGSGYVESWVKLAELLGPDSRGRERVVERLVGLMAGGDSIYLGWGYAALLLPWIGLLAFTWRLARNGSETPLARLFCVGAVVVAGAAVLSPVVVSAGRVAVRSLVAFPLLYAALSSFSFRLKTRASVGLLSLLIWSVFVNSWIAASLFHSDRLARDKDAALAAALIPRIEAVGRPRFENFIPITVVGAWRHPPGGPYYRAEIFGTSFYEHGGGSPWRVAQHLRLLGMSNLRPVPLASIPESIEAIEAIPAWPAEGSVAVVNNVLVVKFGDLTYPQQASLRR